MKRIAWLLLVCLILSLFPVAGAAAGEITVSTADQLRRIGIDASYPMNGTYRLTADVDLSDAEWKAIGHKGDAIVPFTGTFDGDGHRIIGMTTGKSAAYSQGKDGWGLFAQLNGATVKNLVLDEVWLNVFSAGNYNAVGAVAGYVGGGARIENVMVRSGLIRDTGSRQIRLGGIAGSTVGSYSIVNCYNGADLVGGYSTASGSNQRMGMGGILGNASKGGSISHCLNAGTVTAKTAGFAGGIVAHYMADEPLADVTSCYYLDEIDLGKATLAAVPKAHCTAVTEQQLFNGSITGLSTGWTVTPFAHPCPIPLAEHAVKMPEQDLSSAKAAVLELLQTQVMTNYITAEDLFVLAKSAIVSSSIVLSADKETVTPADFETAGKFVLPLTLTQDGQRETFTAELEIPREPILEYTFTSDVSGRADGRILVRSPERTRLDYGLYWGDKNGPLKGMKPLTRLNDSIQKQTVAVPVMTCIPTGATHLWMCYADGTAVTQIKLPEERLLAKEAPLYTFGIISDLHLTSEYAMDAFQRALTAYDRSKVSFVVSLGDNTSDGSATQLENYRKIKNLFPDMTFWSALGNHDVLPWNTKQTPVKQSYNTFRRYFPNYANLADPNVDTPQTGDNAGFDYTVRIGEDDWMIFLSVGVCTDFENQWHGQGLTDNQLAWLDEQLDTYYNIEKHGGRVFLMYHYFTRESGMFNDGATYLDPVSSKKLHEVLRKYPDLIYFSGHNHFAFDCDMNIHNNGTYTSIHTPSLAASTAYKGKGHEMGNEGYFVEMYEDYVIVRGVDFLTDETVSKATFLLGKASDLTVSEPNGAENATEPAQSTSTASSDGNSAPLGLILGIGGGVIGLAAAVSVLLLIKKKKS